MRTHHLVMDALERLLLQSFTDADQLLEQTAALPELQQLAGIPLHKNIGSTCYRCVSCATYCLVPITKIMDDAYRCITIS